MAKKLDDIKSILLSLGIPQEIINDMCCYSLLAMLGVSENTPWKEATNEWIRIHDVIQVINASYGIKYAENSRETIRKKAMHPLRDAGIIEDNGSVTNSPNYRYRITIEALNLFNSYSSELWNSNLCNFTKNHQSLIELYSSKKKMARMPVKINNNDFSFSPGEHNLLQKLILEEFSIRYAHNCICLYVGDSDNRDLIKESKILSSLGFEITIHDKMPDIVLYIKEKNWIYFIECVTSVGPITPARLRQLEDMTKDVIAGKIYITAYLDFDTYKKFSKTLAWETEVWIADMPDHMIHLNGDRFLGPRG